MVFLSSIRIQEEPGADPGFQIMGAHLKKLRRAEGGAKILGYLVWKITILRQKIIFFPILGGCAPWKQSLFLLGIIRYPYEANLNKYKYTNQSFNIQKFALSVCSTWTILGKKSKKLYRYYFLNESLHSDLSTISTKRTLNAHLNSLNIKQDHDI
jgi:hypothetical protein